MTTLKVTPEQEKSVKALGFLRNRGTDNFSARIITVNGKITAAQQRCLAEAAEKFGNGDILFTTRLTIEIPGIPYNKIEEFRAYIAKEGLETGGTGSKVRPVVSCKASTCQYGLIDAYDLSEKIHEKFYKGYENVRLPHKFKIGVGGCPNNCIKPDLNDLGVIGQMVPIFDEELCYGCKKCAVVDVCPIGAVKVVDGVLNIDKGICNDCGRCIGKCHFDAIEDGKPGYKIAIGGRWGKRANIGKAINKIFADENEVMSVIEKMLLIYREQGITGERLSDTIERIGFENIEAQLLSDEILERKQEILDAKLHLTGGATC
ncbi:MAG TPA: (4Fe-4S)-binding protein [Thermoanaerobacterales bacterium]|jgi:dissimilatory sulfite reductase (desulfoviridin) alpha/beta subunit|nr:(4Fe-4S)-binding protein [Thermoanaerobacterales bacterium]